MRFSGLQSIRGFRCQACGKVRLGLGGAAC